MDAGTVMDMDFVSAFDTMGAGGRDALTGLADYDTFRRALDYALAAAPDGRAGMTLALDIARFHRVNACIGYDGGDRILRALGARLRGVAGAALVARAGANRFLFLFSAAAAGDAAAHVMDALAAPFPEGGLLFYLRASMAVARFPEHGASAGQVMAVLDRAMADARRAGADSVREGKCMGEREQVGLEAGLRDAIDSGAIDVHYQPQVDLKHGLICGVEALVRWSDPVAGAVPADRIVSVAEEAGLIGRLGECVLRRACAQAQAWRGMGFGALRVAVNLSARQVCMGDLERLVLEVLGQTGLPPANLDLELTESVVMEDIGRAVACFERLKAHGVQMSLDDFGTGHSSLAYLRLFPIDRLKIDRVFLDLVPGDARAAGLVAAIIATAHALGMHAVAEGVEQQAQLDFLARMGCDEIQGYLFSKPLAATQMTSLLHEGRVFGHPLANRGPAPGGLAVAYSTTRRRHRGD